MVTYLGAGAGKDNFIVYFICFYVVETLPGVCYFHNSKMPTNIF